MRLIALVLCLLPLIVSAETVTYFCNFTSYSNEEGNHKLKNFELNFLIDRTAEKSYILGNNGSSVVYKHETGSQLSFIEITPTGNVMTTSITGSLHSVHSRNSIISNKLIPSQYYGKCEIK